MRGMTIIKWASLALVPVVFASASLPLPSTAQAAASPVEVPRSPKDGAPIDITGAWVSIVNEDWRWRMVTPPKGDFPGLPLTQAGRDAANAWDPATDGSCKAYGVGGLMRMPTRLRISWEGDAALKIETDAGMQTRRLLFGQRPTGSTTRSLQGFSSASWDLPPATVTAQVTGEVQGGNAYRPPGGSLKVVTTNTSGGWVRRNGVPYSENTVITEYFDRFKAQDGREWLTVLTVLEDPTNFNGPFLTSSHYRREDSEAKWFPKPCRGDL